MVLVNENDAYCINWKFGALVLMLSCLIQCIKFYFGNCKHGLLGYSCHITVSVCCMFTILHLANWMIDWLGPRGLTSRKFYAPGSRHENLGTTFGGTAPLKFAMAKTFKIWHNFISFKTSITDISGMDQDLTNWKTTSLTAIPPTQDQHCACFVG